MVLQLESDNEADPAMANGIFPPIYDGLIGYWEHQDSLERARLNLVDGTLSGVVGTPTVEADGMTCTGFSHYLNTGLEEQDDLTYIIVAKALDPFTNLAPGQAMFIGNYRSVPGLGTYLYAFGASATPLPGGALRAISFFGSGAGTIANAGLSQADMTGWRCRSARVGLGVGSTVNDLTAGVTATAANVASPRLRNTGYPILIGSAHTNQFTARTKHLRTAIYRGRRSDLEVATMKAWLAAQVALVDPAIVV
jgi:hypothetical protein